MFNSIQVGDWLERVILGILIIPVRVAAIDSRTISAGGVRFNKETGEELNHVTFNGGSRPWSFLRRKNESTQDFSL